MAQTQKVQGVATSVRGNSNNLSVIYHGTEVVKTEGKTVTLSTGGWRTVTTKTRMNQAANQFALGYSVYQNKGNWFIQIRGNTKAIPFTNSVITFTI